MNIVIFGYPAAGKGTQASLISKEYNIPHISTGEIFRENMEEKTPLGIEIDELMRAGNLVPDEITNQIVFNKLDGLGQGWILDGYPRSKLQAVEFEKYLVNKGWEVKSIYIGIDREEAFYRSKKRSEELGRFEDANDEVINKRLDVFEQTTRLAIEHFEPRVFNGYPSINTVFEHIKEKI